MTLTEKIERVRELLARRDEVERELAELLGGSVADVPSAPANAPKPKAVTPKAAKSVDGKRQVTCKKCGKQGHIAKTCTAVVPTFGDKAQLTTKLTNQQYDEVRDAMRDREFMSGQYSLTHKLPPREVNAAIRSADYKEYLDA